jgi:hypothetical protein
MARFILSGKGSKKGTMVQWQRHNGIMAQRQKNKNDL